MHLAGLCRLQYEFTCHMNSISLGYRCCENHVLVGRFNEQENNISREKTERGGQPENCPPRSVFSDYRPRWSCATTTSALAVLVLPAASVIVATIWYRRPSRSSPLRRASTERESVHVADSPVSSCGAIASGVPY